MTGVTYGDYLAPSIPVSDRALYVGARTAEEIPHWVPRSGDSPGGFGYCALWWAENVGGVFPLTPANAKGANPGKVPLSRDPRDPDGPPLVTGGQWDRASSDERVLARWWTVSPWSNVGLVTQANGILIVDIDPRAGGARAMIDWAREHDVDLSDVPRDTSPSGDGGVHLWWRLPREYGRDGIVYKNGPLFDGVDVSWQVPVAPSLRRVVVRHRGDDTLEYGYRPYTWTAGDPRDLPVAPQELMNAVVNFVGRKKTPDEIVKGRGRRVSNPDGTAFGELPETVWFIRHGFRPYRRNVDCYALACRLWRTHWPHREPVWENIRAAWDQTQQSPTPFPWSEAADRIEWAYKYVAPQAEEARELVKGIRY